MGEGRIIRVYFHHNSVGMILPNEFEKDWLNPKIKTHKLLNNLAKHWVVFVETSF
jgi:hypothetical protein